MLQRARESIKFIAGQFSWNVRRWYLWIL